MQEIKAFIRKQKTEEVVDSLEADGFCCMTIIDVMALGKMSDPNRSQLSVSIAERFSNIVKLEVVCNEEDTDQVIDIIREHARSGLPGDGIIYVTPVLKTMHIRTGDTGGAFLQSRHHSDRS